MHVAILIGRFPPGVVGGAEIQAESWAARLSDRHRVTVITRRDPATQPTHESRDGFDVVRVPVSRIPLWRSAADLLAIDRAVRALPVRPHVLLCFQTFVSGLAGVRTGGALGIPAIVWIRGEDEYRLGSSRLNRFVSPRVWSAAQRVLVQSEENRNVLLRELGTCAPGRLEDVRGKLDVVPNGLDLPQGPFAPGGRVLSVGRLIADKAMDVVIDAAAANREVLTIAGDGPERPPLEARARALGADCRFVGFAGRTELAALYRDASCVVLASRRGEGLPNVLLEAMSFARPVVATPCAGTRDLLEDGVNGLLVPPDDPVALAAALARLRADAALARRLGEAGRQTVERFAWNAVRPRLEAVLERCGDAGDR